MEGLRQAIHEPSDESVGEECREPDPEHGNDPSHPYFPQLEADQAPSSPEWALRGNTKTEEADNGKHKRGDQHRAGCQILCDVHQFESGEKDSDGEPDEQSAEDHETNVEHGPKGAVGKSGVTLEHCQCTAADLGNTVGQPWSSTSSTLTPDLIASRYHSMGWAIS